VTAAIHSSCLPEDGGIKELHIFRIVELQKVIVVVSPIRLLDRDVIVPCGSIENHRDATVGTKSVDLRVTLLRCVHDLLLLVSAPARTWSLPDSCHCLTIHWD